MASIVPIVLNETVKYLGNVSKETFENILIGSMGAYNVIKNLANNRHLLGWRDHPRDRDDDGFLNHLGEDLNELYKDTKRIISETGSDVHEFIKESISDNIPDKQGEYINFINN